MAAETIKHFECFNPSFSMEWSGTGFATPQGVLLYFVSILVFQWNGLELLGLTDMLVGVKCFNPSFSMEWSGTEPGTQRFSVFFPVSILVFQWNGLELSFLS